MKFLLLVRKKKHASNHSINSRESDDSWSQDVASDRLSRGENNEDDFNKIDSAKDELKGICWFLVYVYMFICL